MTTLNTRSPPRGSSTASVDRIKVRMQNYVRILPHYPATYMVPRIWCYSIFLVQRKSHDVYIIKVSNWSCLFRSVVLKIYGRSNYKNYFFGAAMIRFNHNMFYPIRVNSIRMSNIIRFCQLDLWNIDSLIIITWDFIVTPERVAISKNYTNKCWSQTHTIQYTCIKVPMYRSVHGYETYLLDIACVEGMS